MSVASAPAPSMFAVFRRRDFSLLWLAQLISTAGSSLTDLAAGDLRLPRDRVGPGRRPDPDGHGHPQPDRRAARRRLRRSPRPQEDPHRDLPDPGGHRRRPSRSSSASRSIALPGPVRPAVPQRRREAVLRSRPRQPDPRDGERRGARGGQLVPVHRVVRLDRHRVRRQPGSWRARSISPGRSSSMRGPSSCAPG